MNSKILLSVFLAMALIVSAAGLSEALFYMPAPLGGKVTGASVVNLPIQVTGIRTGEILETTTTSAGEYSVNLANFPETVNVAKYQLGDQFRVSITSCSDYPECSKIVTYTGDPVTLLNFDITGIGKVCPVQTCPADKTSDVGLYLYAIIGAIFTFLIGKYVPYGGKMRITRYLDSKKKQKMKIEKYEKYLKADGVSYGYRYRIVADVYV